MWIIYAFFSAFFAGLVAILGKLGLKSIDSTLATTIRSTIMAVFLIVTAIVLKKFNGFSFGSLAGKDWMLIIFAGIAGALSWLCYFWALKFGDATKVVAIDRLSIVFVVIFAALFLGEALTWKTIVGTILLISGAVLMVIK